MNCSMIVLIFLSLKLFAAQEQLMVDEEKLSLWARSNSPAALMAKLKATNAEFQEKSFSSDFETQSITSIRYEESDEDPVINVQPVISPFKFYSTAISKTFTTGTSVSLTAFQQSLTAEGAPFSFDNNAQTGVNLSLSFDLWRNFLGRSNHNQYKSFVAQRKRGNLESQIALKEFEMNVRKIYWSVLAMDERISITEKRLDAAKKQLNDVRARRSQGVADNGDVSRIASLVNSREGIILSFQRERSNLIAQLAANITEFENRSLVFPSIDLNKEAPSFYQCIQQIDVYQKQVESYSFLPDIIALLEEELQREFQVADALNGPDIELTGELQKSNAEQGIGNSLDNFDNNDNSGWAVGVSVSIPLENTVNKAEKAAKLIAKQNYQAQILRARLKLKSEYKRTQENLRLLKAALEKQIENSGNLDTTVRVANRKFRQARLSVNTLIQEEDNLFASLLQEVDLKLLVITELYDFFKTFNRFPCNLNQMGEKS